MTKIQRRRIRLEVLEKFVEWGIGFCNDEQNSIRKIYKVVGEQQDYRWENHERVPLWEDPERTIPVMTDKWDFVEKSDDELSEEDCIRIEILENIIKKLEAIE